ncbi:MAG: DUF418 domain-containing protein [Ferruginibacter sp.]
MSHSASPLLQKERTDIIDILRGFALLGVLIANLEGFITFALPDAQVALMTNTTADKIIGNFLLLFIDNKFITIFSLLFGYGFGVVIERVAAKGIDVNSFFIRRMLWLLLIGLIHMGIWWGEILNVYASSGLLLLLFRKTSKKNLLIWGAFFLFIATPLVQALKICLLPANPPELDRMLNTYVENTRKGNIVEIAKSNYHAVWLIFFERWSQFRDMFEVLGKFLFGYYVLRTGYLENLAANIALVKKVWKASFFFAMIYVAWEAAVNIFEVKVESKEGKVIEFLLTRGGILSLSLFYCSSIMVIYNRYKKAKLFSAFRQVGMMSLTNYLIQTMFYAFFFYGFGFGMMGKVHLQYVIPIGLSFYVLQIFFSRYWMKHYLYGPAEWVWRQLTYKKRLPLKKPKNQFS